MPLLDKLLKEDDKKAIGVYFNEKVGIGPMGTGLQIVICTLILFCGISFNLKLIQIYDLTILYYNKLKMKFENVIVSICKTYV